MAYTKHVWQDENVQYPNRYLVDGQQKTILRDVGTITVQDPISANKLNNMEQGIENAHNYFSPASTLYTYRNLGGGL